MIQPVKNGGGAFRKSLEAQRKGAPVIFEQKSGIRRLSRPGYEVCYACFSFDIYRPN